MELTHKEAMRRFEIAQNAVVALDEMKWLTATFRVELEAEGADYENSEVLQGCYRDEGMMRLAYTKAERLRDYYLALANGMHAESLA